MSSTNKVATEEVRYWVPLEQKAVNDVCRLNSSTLPPKLALKSSLVRLQSFQTSKEVYELQCSLLKWHFFVEPVA